MHRNQTLGHWIGASLASVAVGSAGLGTALAQADPAIAYIADYGFSKGKYRRDLMVANADGTNRSVVWSRTGTGPESMLSYPAWSPDLDGNPANGFRGTLVFYGYALARPVPVLFLMDVVVTGGVAQGANLREVVASDLDPAANGSILNPEWSPDLDPVSPGYQGRIAYRGAQVLNGAGRVNTIDMSWDGVWVQPTYGPNSSVVLSNEAGRYPTWSPDGRRIAAAGAAAPIVVLDASTGAVVSALSVPGDPVTFEWSRTDARIVYRAVTLGNGQLYTVDAFLGIGSIQQVTFEPCAARSPSWSPDDGFLIYEKAFCGSGSGLSTIRRVELSTGATTTLITQPKANLADPAWRRF